ncbi:hypothetical protein [Clostridioides sp. ZZV14-6048]|uniref:hypothetical protein n=1 Tax=Clostridioides sp. ZZV14-6048 TaxID=2811490 RepID=UPI001D1012C9|nr:hypothetical protein [Clostridioides sp. ZZV14-6048]
MKSTSKSNNLDFPKEIMYEAKKLSLEDQRALLKVIENMHFKKLNVLKSNNNQFR